MKISDFVIILGVLVLANSIYYLGNMIHWEIYGIIEGYESDWHFSDTLHAIFLIVAPTLIIGIGVIIRVIESR